MAARFLRLLLVFWVVFLPAQLCAQSDFALQHQTFSPHILRANPALMPHMDLYIGLPVLSNSYAAFGNNSFTYRDFIRKKGTTDSIYFDFEGLLSKMRQQPYIQAFAQTDWLSFGWMEGRYYLSAHITEKFAFRSRFRKELFDLGINGNAQFIGQTINPGDFKVNLSHYREYAFGVSRDFNCKLRVGVTAKFLYGMENIDVARSDIRFTTDEVTFDLHGSSDIVVNTSGLGGFNTDSLSRWTYMFDRGNRGWAADLGAAYKLNDKWQFGASVLDLGKINWRYKPRNFYNQIDTFSFKGIPIEKFFINNVDSIGQNFQNLLDSLSTIFKINERSEAYATPLPSRFYLTGRYTYNKNNDVSLLLMGSFFEKKLIPAASLGFTKRFNDLLEFNANWSYYMNTFSNFGAGFSFNLGLTQFHLSTDNLVGLFGQYNTQALQIRAGITFVSDYPDERPDYCDKDRDGIPNKRDECPDQAGVFWLNGCPDRDKDGIADKNDDCPLEAGLEAFRGCPDKDNDQVPDKNDKCPDEPGKAYLDGCPDRDLDSIPDLMDECPNVAGIRAFKGCPDRDNDSIPDKEDECPDRKGLKMFGGCPDTDGDSIPDLQDQCPEVFGLRVFSGCPDTDKDGTEDRYDNCPNEPGPASRKGCPISDRDGDGLKDELDNCPDKPGPVLNKGCPYDDLDGDMIPDLLDRCPDVPGVPANNGCPELKKEEIEILRTAFDNLEFETGKSVIRETSYASLVELAELLKRKPEWQLLISGHTDNVGKAESNLNLSKNRAKSVETFMVANGVPASRLKSEWFGQTRPIESNKTPEGRQKNRRVELSVIIR